MDKNTPSTLCSCCEAVKPTSCVHCFSCDAAFGRQCCAPARFKGKEAFSAAPATGASALWACSACKAQPLLPFENVPIKDQRGKGSKPLNPLRLFGETHALLTGDVKLQLDRAADYGDLKTAQPMRVYVFGRDYDVNAKPFASVLLVPDDEADEPIVRPAAGEPSTRGIPPCLSPSLVYSPSKSFTYYDPNASELRLLARTESEEVRGQESVGSSGLAKPLVFFRLANPPGDAGALVQIRDAIAAALRYTPEHMSNRPSKAAVAVQNSLLMMMPGDAARLEAARPGALPFLQRYLAAGDAAAKDAASAPAADGAKTTEGKKRRREE